MPVQQVQKLNVRVVASSVSSSQIKIMSEHKSSREDENEGRVKHNEPQNEGAF